MSNAGATVTDRTTVFCTAIVALATVAIIVALVTVGIFATKRTNDRLQVVQVACVTHGGTWVAGQCVR